MTHYALTQLASKHKPLSPAVQTYLDKAKRRLVFGIAFNPEWTPEGRRSELWRFVENASKGLRFVGASHEIDGAHVNHNGWYIDNFQDTTAHGVVYQLPSRKGELLYVPGVNDPFNNDCAILDFHDIRDDKAEAANAADTMAERYAEEAREDEAKANAEAKIEELTDEILEQRTELRELVRELKQTVIRSKAPSGGVMFDKTGAICKALRSQVVSVRAEMHKAYKQRERLKNDYWEAVN